MERSSRIGAAGEQRWAAAWSWSALIGLVHAEVFMIGPYAARQSRESNKPRAGRPTSTIKKAEGAAS